MRAFALALIVIGFFLAPGCSSGPERAEVSGAVTIDGDPIKEASIQFIPVDGTAGPSVGGVVKDGAYRLSRGDGPLVGKNRVELRGFKETGRKVQDPTGKPGTMTTERIQAFPAEYNDNPSVVKDIRSGVNTIDFHVQTKSAGKK